MNWPGLLCASPFGPNRCKYTGSYIYTESTNRVINDFSRILDYGQSNHSILDIDFVMSPRINGYRWIATRHCASLSLAVLSVCPQLA